MIGAEGCLQSDGLIHGHILELGERSCGAIKRGSLLYVLLILGKCQTVSALLARLPLPTAKPREVD